MALSLSGARAKYDRADRLYDEACAEIKRFFDTKPYDAIQKENSQTGSFTIVLRAKVLKQMPTSIPLLIGDAVHNLRAAVDHVAYGLVRVSGNTPDFSTQFPIADIDVAFWGTRGTPGKCNACKKPLKAGKEGLLARRLRGVKDKAILDLVTKWQPFGFEEGGIARPERAPLHVLHKLDVIDKHHGLLVVGSAQTEGKLHFRTLGPKDDPGLVKTRTSHEPVMMDDGAELGRVEAPFPVYVKHYFAYQIAFAQGQVERPLFGPTMDFLMDETKRLIADFEPFFPAAS